MTTLLDFMAVCGLMLTGAAVVLFLVAYYPVAVDWVWEKRGDTGTKNFERESNE